MTAQPMERVPAALPGAPAFDGPLRGELARALEEMGPRYVPRTRHRREDGSPLYSNRLLLESSPYLRQHAHNPVNWHAWGEATLDAARLLGRPVLLSIGYSTCHWCHVMEEESFEDLEVARLLNENYVPVKVDREERPDVDSVYMKAVQVLTGGGGWPLTVWLNPEGEPFFGGTYFPPRDGDRGAAIGFLTLLRRLHELYRQEPARVAEAAGDLVRALRAPRPGGVGSSLPGAEVLQRAALHYSRHHDPVHGGMIGAPKFPSTLPVRFLLREERRSGEPSLGRIAALTLERMAAGGVRDQVGGGFHRYSTDERWLIPHFEKMLYDNALLATAYVEAWQATGRADFADVARDTLDWVKREMTSPEGAFYSATDADSPGPDGRAEEGLFFSWTPEEVEAVLGPPRARLACSWLGIGPRGNFEGRSVPTSGRPLAAVAAEAGVAFEALPAEIAAARAELYQARLRRPPPLRDEKILTSWNGLMISAFARAGLAFGEPRLVRAGAAAADYLLGLRDGEGRLRHSCRGERSGPAFLEDYAFLIAALLDLYEAEQEPRRLEEAIALQGLLEEQFADPQGGGYFLTAAGRQRLLLREKSEHDGAEPSGDSVAALGLLRLHELTLEAGYRRRAEEVLAAHAAMLEEAPMALAEMLLAVDFLHGSPRQIVLVRPAGGGEGQEFGRSAAPSLWLSSVLPAGRGDGGEMLDRLRAAFLPHRVLSVVTEGPDQERHGRLVPAVCGKKALGGKVTAYVCRQGSCELPVTDAAGLAAQLGLPATDARGSE